MFAPRVRSLSTLAVALSLGFSASASGLPASSSGRLDEDPLAPLPASEFGFEEARHLLMRAGFGGTAEEVQRLQRKGLDGMVSWLVDYEQRQDVVGPIEIRPQTKSDYVGMRGKSEPERRKLRQALRRREQGEFQKSRGWWVQRMLRSRRPLEERMTLFWHGHFTSGFRDVRNAYHMHQQNLLLREDATGNFRELLHAIAKDPAMLEYLDNNRNRKGKPNENFAREVMELFTLGLGNYTEKDIKEAARAFTGWTFARFENEYRFNARAHDAGAKTFLGRRGRFNGDDILDIILAQDACAPHVAGRIFSYFAYAQPGEKLRAALGQCLRDNDFEIKPLLRRIFKSRAFYSEESRGAQVKSPIVLLVSTVRMLGMNPPPSAVVIGAAAKLGQDLMLPPNVKGWEGGASWITTATLLDRYNICGSLIKAGVAQRYGIAMKKRGKGKQRKSRSPRDRALRRFARWDPGLSACSLVRVLGAKTDAELVDALAKRLLFVPLPESRRQAMLAFLADSSAGPRVDYKGAASAPQERRLRKLLHLLMSTPEFQIS